MSDIGDRMGEMVWQGILAKARGFIASYWLIAFIAACAAVALYFAGAAE